MARPKIRITLVERRGPRGCHRGHQPGDSFDFDTERGALCPMAMHVAFPYVDILRYGGAIPGEAPGNRALLLSGRGYAQHLQNRTCRGRNHLTARGFQREVLLC